MGKQMRKLKEVEKDEYKGLKIGFSSCTLPRNEESRI